MADDTRARGVPRRTAVAGAVVIAGTAAGCARYGAPAAEPPPISAAAEEGTVLGAASEVPVGGGKIFADQKIVVTQPAKGEFKGFSSICTHQGCAVTAIKDGTIDCECHGSKFAIADGKPAAGPANKPLPAQQVTVTPDGKITTGAGGGAQTTAPEEGQEPPAEKPPVQGLASTKDIPVGGGKVFEGEQVVITQPVEGEFKGFSSICTHQGCAVTAIKDGTINCECHGSKFEVSDGSVRSGPASKPLPYRSVKVEGDQITLA
ncbi:Rieske (2Fe-2S) protein [Actinophytocola sp.]|uniref:Rieske (2Fe-2S) protein n=1 Tax=Actinophytocola sp. TaxID=1872138 RepID=UPI003D6ABA63